MVDTRTVRRRVSEYIRANRMAEKGDGILAAVSGGADSVCLLFLLYELQEELGIRLAAFHLHHGLRGQEADRDEAYTEKVCGQLGVPFLSVHEDVALYAKKHGLSEEEAGRKLRYFHLEKAAETLSCNKIATAHHKDDNAETVLLNLFRGSGLKGLSGIRPVRDNIIRPLLCLTRNEIVEYLQERQISWCEDSTNSETLYARNRIRNELLPWVKEKINDRADEHILNMASLALQADEYFTRRAEMILSEGDGISVDTGRFDSQPEILQSYLVREMVSAAAGSRKDISSKHIEAVCALKGPGGGTAVSLPYGLVAVRGYDRLRIQENKALQCRESIGIRLETKVFPRKKGTEIPKNQYTKWFDYDKIKDTLSVRCRENGDYLMIAGGRKKLLRRYFIDEKIPEADRASVPLLTEGNHVLWVIGLRISEYYKITEATRTILEVKACKGEENG